MYQRITFALDINIKIRKEITMNKGTAYWIFGNIENNLYTNNEKFEAIKIVSESETHNAIRKSEMVEALKWLLKHDGRVNQCQGCAYEDPEAQEECSHCMRAYSDCYFKP